MSFARLKNTRSKSVRLGQNTYVQTEYHISNDNSSNSKWLIFWQKITRAKKKSSGTPKTYDHQSYLQNFDDGPHRIEPDYLYRSFSARYANPSRFKCHGKEFM
ncbi:structural maintenance of chromosome 3 [Striga asiatica]|uniref:Structural maintenance of chromosome 3 n=1 Tax=Striga asiatica TaxID=4170 RepID=A0A5A7Q6L4_STRAF|nr:structural maintenance of chromosome 3 [Striga asiatica]